MRNKLHLSFDINQYGKVSGRYWHEDGELIGNRLSFKSDTPSEEIRLVSKGVELCKQIEELIKHLDWEKS